MVTERYSRSTRKVVLEIHPIQEFVEKIKSQEIIGISENSNLAKLMDEEKKQDGENKEESMRFCVLLEDC